MKKVKSLKEATEECRLILAEVASDYLIIATDDSVAEAVIPPTADGLIALSGKLNAIDKAQSKTPGKMSALGAFLTHAANAIGIRVGLENGTLERDKNGAVKKKSPLRKARSGIVSMNKKPN